MPMPTILPTGQLHPDLFNGPFVKRISSSSRPRDDGLLGASFGEFMRCMAWNNFCYKPKGVFSNFLDNPHGN